MSSDGKYVCVDPPPPVFELFPDEKQYAVPFPASQLLLLRRNLHELSLAQVRARHDVAVYFEYPAEDIYDYLASLVKDQPGHSKIAPRFFPQ